MRTTENRQNIPIMLHNIFHWPGEILCRVAHFQHFSKSLLGGGSWCKASLVGSFRQSRLAPNNEVWFVP